MPGRHARWCAIRDRRFEHPDTGLARRSRWATDCARTRTIERRVVRFVNPAVRRRDQRAILAIGLAKVDVRVVCDPISERFRAVRIDRSVGREPQPVRSCELRVLLSAVDRRWPRSPGSRTLEQRDDVVDDRALVLDAPGMVTRGMALSTPPTRARVDRDAHGAVAIAVVTPATPTTLPASPANDPGAQGPPPTRVSADGISVPFASSSPTAGSCRPTATGAGLGRKTSGTGQRSDRASRMNVPAFHVTNP